MKKFGAGISDIDIAGILPPRYLRTVARGPVPEGRGKMARAHRYRHREVAGGRFINGGSHFDASATYATALTSMAALVLASAMRYGRWLPPRHMKRDDRFSLVADESFLGDTMMMVSLTCRKAHISP